MTRARVKSFRTEDEDGNEDGITRYGVHCMVAKGQPRLVWKRFSDFLELHEQVRYSATQLRGT